MVNNLIYDPKKNKKTVTTMPYNPNTNPAKVTQYGGVQQPRTYQPGTTPTSPGGMTQPQKAKPKDVFNPPSGQMSVRQYLTNNGYKDDAITYDNGQVYLNGKTFMQVNPNADGRTYSTGANLERAMNTYKQQGYNSQLESSLGKVNDLLNKPYQYKPFEYNQATLQADPVYQAALKQYQQNANRASNNAMVATGNRGIGNSSITTDRVAQIQNQSMVDLDAQLTPQLIAQAYQRHNDAQNAERTAYRDALGDWGSYASTMNNLGQQIFNNDVTESGMTGKWRGESTLPMKIHNTNTALQIGDRAGRVVAPADSVEEVIRRAQDPNAPMTWNAQQDTRKTRLDELWTVAEQTGTIPNELADMYGIPRGTKTEQARQWGLSYDLEVGKQQDKVDGDLLKMIYDNQPQAAKGPTAATVAASVKRFVDMAKERNGGEINLNDRAVVDQIEDLIASMTDDPLVAVPVYREAGIPVPAELQADYQAALGKYPQ